MNHDHNNQKTEQRTIQDNPIKNFIERPIENNIILIDKPAGITSFGVVARVRKKLSEQTGRRIKVGHTGTLDPFATGLLILLADKATKRSNEFLKLDKWYEATILLGKVSTTGDPEGEITDYPAKTQLSSSIPSYSEVEQVINAFIGRIIQVVPRFSAIKINGQRAYTLARKGQQVEMPSREIEIYSIKILKYQYPELIIKTHVSSGTYIRTLGEDIGKKLGVGAYLTSLRRTKIGDFNIEDAIKI